MVNLSHAFTSPTEKFLVVLGVVTVMAWLAINMARGGAGRNWMAVRAMDVAAEVMGLSLAWTKLQAFAVSSFYCGLGGALFAYTRSLSRADLRAELDRVCQRFPRLKVRRASQAGYTAGGEQKMTAIGRAMMARPDTLLLEEPSMGLAPRIVAEIFEIMRDLNQREGIGVLLAEQNASVALKYADYGYILESGRIMMDGDAKALAENADVKEVYLGISGDQRESFRNRKPCRRRKRWL
jgi:ABC-type branched-subunit amino acid transport system ATPase component